MKGRLKASFQKGPGAQCGSQSFSKAHVFQGSNREKIYGFDICGPLPVRAGGTGGRRGPAAGAGGRKGGKRQGAVPGDGGRPAQAQSESALRGKGAGAAGGFSRQELRGPVPGSGGGGLGGLRAPGRAVPRKGTRPGFPAPLGARLPEDH